MKEINFFMLEVDPLESELEDKQGGNWCSRSAEKRCLENDDAEGAAPPWTSRRVAALTLNPTVTHVCALLKPRCCSGAGSPVIRYCVNEHEETENI